MLLPSSLFALITEKSSVTGCSKGKEGDRRREPGDAARLHGHPAPWLSWKESQSALGAGHAGKRNKALLWGSSRPGSSQTKDTEACCVILVLRRAIKKNAGIPVVAQWVKNPTSIPEDVGLIPGLAQWVKDPALLWLWGRLATAAPSDSTRSLGISICRGIALKESKRERKKEKEGKKERKKKKERKTERKKEKRSSRHGTVDNESDQEP